MKKILILLTLLLIITVEVNALPPLPNEFYGRARYYNSNISLNTLIIAYVNDIECGRFRSSVYGAYGSLSCLGNDTQQGGTQGGTNEANVTFTISGVNATAVGDTNWTTGQFSFVNISAPVVACGDNFCDAVYEFCDICTADCGTCPSNETNGTGGDGGGGNSTGGGGDSSGGDDDSTSDSPGESVTGDITYIDAPFVETECNENWECGDWGICRRDGLQFRNCTDSNNCGTNQEKPLIIKSCSYLPTCFDGIRNGDETGTDCGGSCAPCSHCVNGILDGDEEQVDCGGRCAPCPSCFDGIRNQGEEGIDCGGPCEQICEVIIQRPGYVCTKDIGPFNFIFWLLIAAVLLSDVFAYGIYKVKENYVRNNKKLDDFKKAAKIYMYKRNSFIYIIATLVVVAMIILYYWFIGVCEDLNIRYLWILGILLVAAYFIINYLITLFEQNEKKTLKLAKLTQDSHYKHLEEMIAFHKRKLSELVVEITNIINLLVKDSEFTLELQKNEDFKKVYQDIMVITNEKLKVTEWEKQKENNVAEDLKEKLEQESVQKVTKEHPQFEALTRRLQILVEQYDELKNLSQEKDQMEQNAVTEDKKEETEENTENKEEKEVKTEDKKEDKKP